VADKVLIRRPTDLGLAVATARRARGLTQEQLADATGIDRTYLARLEAGLSTLFVQRLLRLLRRLGAELVVVLPEARGTGEETSR
jgi:transcriptional regulator with XRE-family HTH domain